MSSTLKWTGGIVAASAIGYILTRGLDQFNQAMSGNLVSADIVRLKLHSLQGNKLKFFVDVEIFNRADASITLTDTSVELRMKGTNEDGPWNSLGNPKRVSFTDKETGEETYSKTIAPQVNTKVRDIPVIVKTWNLATAAGADVINVIQDVLQNNKPTFNKKVKAVITTYVAGQRITVEKALTPTTERRQQTT